MSLFDDAFVLLLTLLLVFVGFVFVLFVPSFLEVRKPKDKGPRRVRDSTLDRLGVKVQRLSDNGLRLRGDLKLPSGLEFEENVIVEGSATISARCHFGKGLKIQGDVTVGNGVVIDENLIVDGDVNVLDEAIIGGSISAAGKVKLGEKVYVGGSVVSDGNVELFENSEVVGGILSGKYGTIKVKKVLGVEFPASIDDVG